MTLTLYSLRTADDAYVITKIFDGEPVASYITSRTTCTCPAGVRPTCRHRQMLPHLLNAQIANTHWFYEFERGAIVDFEGTPKAALDRILSPIVPQALCEAEVRTPSPEPEGLLAPLEGELITVPTADGWGAKDVTPQSPPQPAAFRRRI